MELPSLLNILQFTLIFHLSLAFAVNICTRTARNFLLSYLVANVLYILLADIFWIYIHDNIILQILSLFFSSAYYGPLLYLYLVDLIKNKSNYTNMIKHFLLCFSILLVFTIIKNVADLDSLLFSLFRTSISELIIIIYFLKGYTLLRAHMSNEKYVLKRRFWFFYVYINGYLITSSVIFFISLFELTPLEIVKSTSTIITSFYYSNLQYPIWILFCFGLSLYAITEVKWLKNWFVSDTKKLNIFNNLFSETPTHVFIEKDIVNNKRFLEKNLSLKRYSKMINMEKQDIIEYLNINGFGSFSSLLNYYRVQEFKNKVEGKSFHQYTLIGIAQECGFQSKSTFFRVFKQLENETPGDFISRCTDL